MQQVQHPDATTTPPTFEDTAYTRFSFITFMFVSFGCTEVVPATTFATTRPDPSSEDRPQPAGTTKRRATKIDQDRPRSTTTIVRRPDAAD
jgi:hypothetical protein